MAEDKSTEELLASLLNDNLPSVSFVFQMTEPCYSGEAMVEDGAAFF